MKRNRRITVVKLIPQEEKRQLIVGIGLTAQPMKDATLELSDSQVLQLECNIDLIALILRLHDQVIVHSLGGCHLVISIGVQGFRKIQNSTVTARLRTRLGNVEYLN